MHYMILLIVLFFVPHDCVNTLTDEFYVLIYQLKSSWALVLMVTIGLDL